MNRRSCPLLPLRLCLLTLVRHVRPVQPRLLLQTLVGLALTLPGLLEYGFLLTHDRLQKQLCRLLLRRPAGSRAFIIIFEYRPNHIQIKLLIQRRLIHPRKIQLLPIHLPGPDNAGAGHLEPHVPRGPCHSFALCRRLILTSIHKAHRGSGHTATLLRELDLLLINHLVFDQAACHVRALRLSALSLLTIPTLGSLALLKINY